MFAENSQGAAFGMRCQFYLVRSTTGNSILASYAIPSMFQGVTLMLDSSPQWCLSFTAFHAIPTMKFGENQVAVIADKSLIFILAFEEAFNLTFSIFRAYDCSALAYHCIPKSKAMDLILHISDAQDNGFTELLVVANSRINVELDRNFVLIFSHKTLEFFQLNAIGQVPLPDTLDSYVGENKGIFCYVNLWHHQSVLTCFQVESRNTLAYLAENVGHYMHKNCSDSFENLSDLNLDNLWDATQNQMCSMSDDPVSRVQLAPVSPLLLLNNNQCISLVRAVCSFLRQELQFPTHLVVQVRESYLARVESTKRISKHDMLMKLVIVFEELVTIWCNSLLVICEASSSTCRINWLRFQPTIISASFQPMHFAFATEEIEFYTIKRDLADRDASVEYEVWANNDVECGSACENQRASVKNFKRASQGIFCWSLSEFQIVLGQLFNGKSCTQCEASGAFRCGRNDRVCWKGTKDCSNYSTLIDDNKKVCDCKPFEMGKACLVVQYVNVVVLHNLAVLAANLFNWLDQMHKDIALAIEVSGQDFIWDANTDRDNHNFVLFYSNLEDKVLFEGESNVTNLPTMEDLIDIMSNYIWDPG